MANVKYNYRCSNGHTIGTNEELSGCPVYVKGSPCKGTLTRFGPGSQTSAKKNA